MCIALDRPARFQNVALPAHFHDIGTGAEPPARPRNHQATQLVIGGNLLQLRDQVFAHVRIERIQLFGPVEHKMADTSVAVKMDRHSVFLPDQFRFGVVHAVTLWYAMVR
jgi:hypothetical protein